jgi:hypothetical protein
VSRLYAATPAPSILPPSQFQLKLLLPVRRNCWDVGNLCICSLGLFMLPCHLLADLGKVNSN